MARKRSVALLILSVGAVLSRPLPRHFETTCDSSNTVVVCEKQSGKFLPAANPNITSLHIIDSDMTFLTEDDILGFRNLETINIAGCTIPVELGNILSRLKKLEVLEISDSNVGGDFALGVMRSLVSLSLEGNQLTRLSQRALGSLPLLEVLDLSRNAIAEVEAGALEALPRLRALRLKGNPLCERAAGASALALEQRWRVVEDACGAGQGVAAQAEEEDGAGTSRDEGGNTTRASGSERGVAAGGGSEGGGAPGGEASAGIGDGDPANAGGGNNSSLGADETVGSSGGAGERERLSQGQVLLLVLGLTSGMVVGVALTQLIPWLSWWRRGLAMVANVSAVIVPPPSGRTALPERRFAQLLSRSGAPKRSDPEQATEGVSERGVDQRQALLAPPAAPPGGTPPS